MSARRQQLTSDHTGSDLVSGFLSAFTEQYFKDGDVTLNERFSALQKGDASGAETEELTLDARFSSHR